MLETYKKYNVDYKYFECSHSGHGLQMIISHKEWMESVEEYLDKYEKLIAHKTKTFFSQKNLPITLSKFIYLDPLSLLK